MTNRERLMKMSLYDLIMSMERNKCRLRMLTGNTAIYVRCAKFKSNCTKCVAKWLNEEEGVRNG